MPVKAKSVRISAPKGGKVHFLDVVYDSMRPWNEAIRVVGSHASYERRTRQIGDKYPPKPDEFKMRKIILVNFGKEVPTGQLALDWAKSRSLQTTNPRAVFAIGETRPTLPTDLGLQDMAIVSTEPCLVNGNRNVCCVWWLGPDRNVLHVEFDAVWNQNAWFAFEQSTA